MGRIAYRFKGNETTAKVRTYGKLHSDLRYLEKHGEVQAKFLHDCWTMRNLEQELIFGLVERRLGPKARVFYRITETGREALKVLEETQPWDDEKFSGLVRTGGERRLYTPTHDFPYSGYKYVDIPIKINAFWHRYFKTKTW